MHRHNYTHVTAQSTFKLSQEVSVSEPPIMCMYTCTCNLASQTFAYCRKSCWTYEQALMNIISTNNHHIILYCNKYVCVRMPSIIESNPLRLNTVKYHTCSHYQFQYGPSDWPFEGTVRFLHSWQPRFIYVQCTVLLFQQSMNNNVISSEF